MDELLFDINKDGTTKEELLKILKKLNINDVHIDWDENIDKNKRFNILNLGDNIRGGTHWVAVDNKNKEYFDAYGFPPPLKIKDYSYNKIPLQYLNSTLCGQYCCLWIYYKKNNNIDGFYNLFFN